MGKTVFFQRKTYHINNIFPFISLQTITKHFKTIPIKEKEILTYFIYMVKSHSNKLDQKNGLGNDAT